MSNIYIPVLNLLVRYDSKISFCKYLCKTLISFSSESSLPNKPLRSIHFTACNVPDWILSSTKKTSEKAPLKDKKYYK